jgi:hypothetical protein
MKTTPMTGSMFVAHGDRDRRRAPRTAIECSATAFCLGRRFGEIHELRTIDYSPCGISAEAHAQLEPGMIVSIGMSSPGCAAGCGHVVRCERAEHGYHVAVCFDGW